MPAAKTRGQTITPDNVAEAIEAALVETAIRMRLSARLAPDHFFGPSGKARAAQRPPDGDWRTWLILAGRGFGKTRTGAEWIRHAIQHGHAKRVALVGATAADVRDVMVEGESGLIAACHRANIAAHYEPGRRRVLFPDHDAVAFAYSAQEPDRLRGPQHDLAWADELAAWTYADTWAQLQFGLRLGENPRQIVTTTPRPTQLVKDLMKDPRTTTTTGTTYDNLENLAPAFRDIIKRFENTRLGEQELMGRMLTEIQGALWTLDTIERNRRSETSMNVRVVVAVDPQASYDPENPKSETGIIVAGVDRAKHYHVLADLSGNYLPDEWARRVVHAFDDSEADRVVIEVNQGGKMVAHTLRTIRPNLPIQEVRATRGKQVRAEPVAALYEQGKVHHLGLFPHLEEQMTTWVPEMTPDSPDRVDALTYAIQALAFSGTARVGWT